MTINLLEIIVKSLKSAMLNKEHFKDNSLRSAVFVSELGKTLFDEINRSDLDLHVIGVDNSGKKKPGEWLLDITIVKNMMICENDEHPIPAVIEAEWGIESESSSKLKEFAKDFSKLVVTNANNHLYLHGFNQGTQKATNNFILRRLRLASKILKNRNQFPQSFYMGFWPSPEKPSFRNSVDSIWDLINLENNSKYCHLNEVFLYKLDFEKARLVGESKLF